MCSVCFNLLMLHFMFQELINNEKICIRTIPSKVLNRSFCSSQSRRISIVFRFVSVQIELE